MKVLIVGLGHIFRLCYFKWIISFEHICDIYLYDRYLESDDIKTFLVEAGIDIHDASNCTILDNKLTFTQVLHEVAPDKVFILTNNSSHFDLCNIALRSGADVLVEKPASITLAEFVELEKCASESKQIFFPAYHQLYRSETASALNSLSIIKESSSEISIFIRSGTNKNYPSHFMKGGFLLREHAGGGVLLDLGSHYISVALLFLSTLRSNILDFPLEGSKGTCHYSAYPREKFVESSFNGSWNLNDVTFDIRLSYNEILPTSVSIYQGSQKLLDWPQLRVEYSHLAFKNMINDYMSLSRSQWANSVTNQSSNITVSALGAIRKTIETIEILYSISN